MRYLTSFEIQAAIPDSLPTAGHNPLECAREVISDAGHWHAGQQLGRRWPIGCVALEITQRCNLDCTLCYLSEHSEAVRDLPLEEVYRRIELIHQHYGHNTDVQITGGEATLRKRSELLDIVRAVRRFGMRSTLMTNGIKATRSLLEALADAGLCDVAFHVDTTQQIKGYQSEVDLNAVREKYIERARGLPIAVFFNTTVHNGNFHEIPELVEFFAHHADVVRTVSFQLQAETGRGVEGKRDQTVTPQSVARQIQLGAATAINFDASIVGHPQCNRYGKCLAINGRLYDLFDDADFISRMQAATAHLVWDRSRPLGVVAGFLEWIVTSPKHWLPALSWSLKKGWQIKRDLWLAKGRLRTLSFVVHNFMDAGCLEPDRLAACVFKTMTRDGPISMCLHNAKRDAFILQPIKLTTASVECYWQPISGELSSNRSTPEPVSPDHHPLKRLRGRTRRNVIERRLKARAANSCKASASCSRTLPTSL